MRNFAAAIANVHGVRPAHIELSHVPRRWSIRVATYLTVRATEPVAVEPTWTEPVTVARYVLGTWWEGCISRCASSPSLVSRISPSVSASSRPT